MLQNVEKSIENTQYSYNVQEIFLDKIFEKYPFKLGTIFPQCRDDMGRNAYIHHTYSQIKEESDRYACGLIEKGVRQGSRVLILIPPSLEFTILFSALFKIGAIPVLIDPGMGILRMLKSIGHVKPDVFIGVSKAHLARIFSRKYFKTVKIPITFGKKWLWRGSRLKDLRSKKKNPNFILSS